MRIFFLLGLAVKSLWHEFVLRQPDEFSKFKVRHYIRRGCDIHNLATLSPNVRLRGRIKLRAKTSIAQNGALAGETAGIVIGNNVMVAPNVVMVAFDHTHTRTDIPMSEQGKTEAEITIEDDVWVGANVTIYKGVTIGEGAIIGANSCVVSDIAPMSINGGVPACLIKCR